MTEPPPQSAVFEQVQRIIARAIATHPPGRNLLMIGGFRYRLLDISARRSLDIDYHWSGDLTEKQAELLALCRRIIIPQVRRQLGCDGDAREPMGPGVDSVQARFVNVAFWKRNVPFSRIEIPLEITRVQHTDPVTVRTAEGVVYPTLSDGDLIEAKAIAVVNRSHLAHRDLIDLFLFGDRFLPDSAGRLRAKLAALGIDSSQVKARLDDLKHNAEYHARAVQTIIDGQLDPVAAANLTAGGGGVTVVRQALQPLEQHLGKH